jgi:hypothetical protein
MTTKKEVIAPEVQQVVLHVHFHAKPLKLCAGGTKRCPGRAPVDIGIPDGPAE